MTDCAILTRGLTRRFGKKNAVVGLDMEVPTGSVFGFLGRNGAGKTTTIRMLVDMLAPTEGEMQVLGLDPQRQGVELRQRIGYVPENPIMYGWMKIGELVRFTGSFYPTWNQDKVEALLSRFGLDSTQKVKSLSRGMNAQLILALALGHDPELLILDEPTSGLDVLVRRDFLESIVQVIQEEGRTVFFSSHLVHEVERVADRVAILEEGKLLTCGEVDEIKGKVKKVMVRTGSEKADLSGIPGVVDIQGEGEQQLLTLVDFKEEKMELLESQGVQILEKMDLSLEESFAEYVRPRGGVS